MDNWKMSCYQSISRLLQSGKIFHFSFFIFIADQQTVKNFPWSCILIWGKDCLRSNKALLKIFCSKQIPYRKQFHQRSSKYVPLVGEEKVFFCFFNKHVDALSSLWALISGTPCLLAWVYLPYRLNSSLLTLRHDLQLNLQQGCAWLCESMGGLSMLSDNQSQGSS